MECKLIKTSKDSHHNGHYFLNNSDGFAIGSTDKDWCKRAISKNPLYILSLKNCQAIANGYDLDELARTIREEEESYIKINKSLAEGVTACLHFEVGVRRGFQKALEILGDKKFNYGHLDKMFTCGKLYQDSKNEAYCFDNVLNKFQQTEWDVEIEMEYQGFKKDYKPIEAYLPKLDADGCLILKRK